MGSRDALLRALVLSVFDEPGGFRQAELVDDDSVKPMSIALIDRWIRALL